MGVADKAMNVMWAILGVVIVLSLVAGTVAYLQDAGDKIQPEAQCEDEAGGYWNEATDTCQVSDTNTTELDEYKGDLPFAGFFGPTGLIILIFMILLFAGVIGMISMGKGK